MDTATLDPAAPRLARAGTRRASLAVLWACVAAFVVITVLVATVQEMLWRATPLEQTDPLDGLTLPFVIACGVVFGLAPLVTAITVSARRERDGRVAAGTTVTYTLLCGLATTATWRADVAGGRDIALDVVQRAEQLLMLPVLLGALPPVPIILLVSARRRRAATTRPGSRGRGHRPGRARGARGARTPTILSELT